MSVYYAAYELQNGFIHNWLVAGPQVIPISDLDRVYDYDFKLQVARHHHEQDSGITQPPVERATFTVGDTELTWHYVRCLDDHYVDLSASYHTCHFLRAWAYARVSSPAARQVTLVLTTHGPADLWVNGEHVHRHQHFHHQAPCDVTLAATFEEGHNEILVRAEQVALRECPFTVALQIAGLSGDVAAQGASVLLPISNEGVARRQSLERVMQAAYLDQDVYSVDDEIVVHWPEDMEASAKVAARLQTLSGRIYAESHNVGGPSDHAGLQRPVQIPEGPYHVVLMPNPQEYYDWNMRIQRKIGLWSVRSRYSRTPYGTHIERRREALQDAARREDTVFAEMAKMALEQWSAVKTDPIMRAVDGVNRREDGSDLQLIGLLGILHRYDRHPAFPQTLKSHLEECVLSFRYWMDEPGYDAMCFSSESRQILFHACEILAGQLYPDRIFTNAGQTGQWHRKKGERMAASWMRQRGTRGFQEWDSDCFFAQNLVALVHLADLAENPQVWELAAVLMDKMFFALALNSFRGVFGSTHGCTNASLIKGGRLAPTAGISRLMWGMGAFNHHVPGTASLACSEEYELPSIIQDVAWDMPEEMWSRERHAGELEGWCDNATGTWEVNKVTYKTPDYMLCSAQDHRPGETGAQEHIWQATLGPDAVVFVTHPPCMSESDALRPNYWRGNKVLPRVAQWQDVLIAIHALPENDWMGFTHAYFPVHAFDEYVLRAGADGSSWAFARKGDGYLALTAAQGLELITRGDTAYRELRSHGRHNVWLCQMGRAALDAGFGEFQDRLLAQRVDFDGLSVRLTTLRGESLAFGWEGPFLVDGKELPITGFKHFENPYCQADWPSEQIQIRFGDQVLGLEFGL